MKQKTLIWGVISILLISGLNASAQLPSPTSLVVNYDLTSVDKNLKAGDSGTIIVVIQNTGGLPAKEVKASILYTSGVSASDSWNLGTINPGQSVTVTTKINVADTVKAGTYLLPLNLDYKSERYDYTGKLKTEDADSEWKISIRVYGEASFQFSITEKEFYKDVSSELIINGVAKGEVRNLNAEISGNCASIIGSEKIYIGNLKPNQNFVLNYAIKPNAVGTCTMSVNLDYDDPSGNSETETESFGLDIKRSNVDIKVSDISYPLLNPGDTADITLALENLGSADASDATVILGLTMEDISKIPAELIAQMALDYPFVVVGSSEKYIKNFAGGKSKDVSFKIRINNDAKTKAYEIPLKIKYFDSAGTEHEITKTVGIEVRGKPEIEVRIKESEITKSKNIGKISVEVLNKGSSDAQFFNIKIIPTEQYSVISNSEEYIGSLESDDSENVDFDIKIYNTQDVDTVPVSLSIEYKDNYNKEYKKDLTVNLVVLSDGDLGQSISIFILIIILLVVVVAIYLIYRKIR